MKAGWLSPSRVGSEPSWPTTLFCENAQWINFEREQFSFPEPGPFTDQIRYHLEPGIVGSLYVNGSAVPTLIQQLQPIDRNATLYVSSTQSNDTGPVTSATLATYTVPTGKWLLLEYARIRLRRTVVATSQTTGTPRLTLSINNVPMIVLDLTENVVGEVVSDDIKSPLYLPAATVVESLHQNPDTGGSVNHRVSLVGMLFDA
jgi:hypothetical protein